MISSRRFFIRGRAAQIIWLQPDDLANFWAKEMGHRMEPVVAQCYGDVTGNPVIEDTGLYQHAKYPFALANLDYRVVEKITGREGVLEIKTTTYHKMSSWADYQIPVYYELQVRFYLAVMDLEFADICCMWGFNPDTDMAIRRINRDRVIEAEIFERLADFTQGLEKGLPPTMSEVAPEQALAALGRILGKSDSTLPTIDLPRKLERKVSGIAKLQEEIRAIDRRKREIEKDVAAYAVQIAETMQTHEHGLLEAPGKKFFIDYVSKDRTAPDRKKLETDFPDVYKEVLKTTTSRSIKVRLESA